MNSEYHLRISVPPRVKSANVLIQHSLCRRTLHLHKRDFIGSQILRLNIETFPVTAALRNSPPFSSIKDKLNQFFKVFPSKLFDKSGNALHITGAAIARRDCVIALLIFNDAKDCFRSPGLTNSSTKTCDDGHNPRQIRDCKKSAAQRPNSTRGDHKLARNCHVSDPRHSDLSLPHPGQCTTTCNHLQT